MMAKPRQTLRSAAVGAATLLVALLFVLPARATPSDLSIDAFPIFASGSMISAGWNEFVVRMVSTSATKTYKGTVEATVPNYSSLGQGFRSVAPFAVGPGAAVNVRLPVNVELYTEVSIRVTDESGELIASSVVNPNRPGTVTLIDVSEASRLRGAIGEAAISPNFVPYTGGRSAAPTSQLSVISPRFDPATGDPILPDRAALYSSADAVVIRSDLLARLSGAELDALAGYVLGGGTLAVAIVRPEDVRLPALAAFAGGPISQQTVSATTLRELTLPAPSSSMTGGGTKIIPPAKNALDGTGPLAGYAGGNLHGSAFGSSAFYGLGEVHLLAFDPSRKSASEDPWVQIRMVDLARRGYDRRATQVFRPGAAVESPAADYNAVRQQLDPNESSRWAIGAAALLLCIYSVLAGPWNFSRAAKKGKPLRALLHLPIFAAVGFVLVVAIGIAAKGVSGRTRHVTMVEAGAGMGKGTARRFRGFFSPSSRELTIKTSDASSLVSVVAISGPSDPKRHLLVDREGARLVDVAALPWQTIVVREDGFASLGDGISITKSGDKDVVVTNRSGHLLRSAILKTPAGDVRYFPKIADGARVVSTSAKSITSLPEGSQWVTHISVSTRAGAVDLHHLSALWLGSGLDKDTDGLTEAWRAVEEAAGDQVDWFPDGVPVLIGQLEGGEGRSSDSGMRLETDRTLFRVVGFGGRP